MCDISLRLMRAGITPSGKPCQKRAGSGGTATAWTSGSHPLVEEAAGTWRVRPCRGSGWSEGTASPEPPQSHMGWDKSTTREGTREEGAPAALPRLTVRHGRLHGLDPGDDFCQVRKRGGGRGHVLKHSTQF